LLFCDIANVSDGESAANLADKGFILLVFILKIAGLIDHKNNKKASRLKICYQKKVFPLLFVIKKQKKLPNGSL
jgi:hypothetical protein